MIYTEKRDELIPALFNARKAMSSKAKKNTANNHLKSKYANLESFLEAIRPSLEANNLMIQQSWEVGPERNIIYLNTEVMHVSGQSLQVTSPFPITKPDAHGVGSAITYARRYAIACVFGIAQADDDGNATVVSSTDIVNSLGKATELDKLKQIYDYARRPEQFGNDSAAMRVITAKYNEQKASLVQPGQGFNIAQKPQPTQPEPTAEPEAPADNSPGNFSDF